MRRQLAALVAVLSLLPSAAEAADAARLLRERGIEFCFGRVYDAAHLKRQMRQELSALHVFKSFAMDPLSEDKQVAPERLIAMDKSGAQKVTVVRRHRKGHITDARLECGEIKPRVFECTAGSEELADHQLEIRASGKRLFAKNGLEENEVYRLEPRPAGECLAWRDRARPAWVGKGPPLRVRFAERAPVCLTSAP